VDCCVGGPPHSDEWVVTQSPRFKMLFLQKQIDGPRILCRDLHIMLEQFDPAIAQSNPISFIREGPCVFLSVKDQRLIEPSASALKLDSHAGDRPRLDQIDLHPVKHTSLK
jgi:hypothetical protein